MRAHPHEIAVGFFDGRWEVPNGSYFPDPRGAFEDADDALQFLKDLTGEDFGKNAALWEEWFKNCPADWISFLYENYPSVVQSPGHPRFKERVDYANERWKEVTTRQCSKCGALCPEYRRHCGACGSDIGRVTMA